MRVDVAAPVIDGDTVTFRWTQSDPNPYQSANGFYLRYEDIDLTRFSSSLFYEIFLGLQLKVFAAYGKPVELVVPEPVPRQTGAFWQAFHDAEHVTISPLGDDGPYPPWASSGAVQTAPRYAGVLFGGGKDSTLATCLLAEIYGADEVVLFQFVAPQLLGQRHVDHDERRQEALMLRPARERLGVATQRAWTDYVAQLHRAPRHARPHLELYTVGLLPAILTRGVSICTTSLPWTSYPIRHLDDGQVWFRYARSRPEMMATQSSHYRRTLGASITLNNTHLLFNPWTSFRVLAERYPTAFTGITMCLGADVGERWCYRCPKCAEYARFSLAAGMIDPRFDYNRIFTVSPYIQKVVAYVEGGAARTVFGNVPWQRFLGTGHRHLVDCHALFTLSPDPIAGRVSAEAYANLLLLKAAFGNTAFPAYERAPTKAVDLSGLDVMRRVAAIAAEHLELVDPLPGPFLSGNTEIDYDFGIRMPTKTGLLDHIRG